jgi:hypothetical protein
MVARQRSNHLVKSQAMTPIGCWVRYSMIGIGVGSAYVMPRPDAPNNWNKDVLKSNLLATKLRQPPLPNKWVRRPHLSRR